MAPALLYVLPREPSATMGRQSLIMFRSMILAFTLWGGVPLCAIAQSTAPVQPAPELRHLGFFLGDWIGTTGGRSAAPERSSGNFKMVHNGHWMRGEVMHGRDYNATLLIAWNADEKAYLVHIFDARSAKPTVAQGTLTGTEFVIESISTVNEGIRLTFQMSNAKESAIRVVLATNSVNGWAQESVTNLWKPERGSGLGMPPR